MVGADRLESLRAEALRRHKAATRKISRLNKEVGVIVSGSRHDPRRDRRKIGRYNEKQLKAYIDTLNSFIDRKIQFVPDANRDPLPRQQFNELKDTFKKLRDRGMRTLSEVGDLKLPGTDMTVLEWNRHMKSMREGMRSPDAVSPFEIPKNFSSRALMGEKALKKMLKTMKGRLDDDFEKRLTKKHRESARKMLKDVGLEDVADKLDQMSDKKFRLIFHYSPFIDKVKLKYENVRAMLKAPDKSHAFRNAQNAMMDSGIYEYISWADKIKD